jgi:hypothetical protein
MAILDSAFDEQVRVRKIFVGRSTYEGKSIAAITINTRNIVLKDDFPVYWKPSDAPHVSYGRWSLLVDPIFSRAGRAVQQMAKGDVGVTTNIGSKSIENGRGYWW